MELTELSRKMLVETGKTLKGVERRLFMARDCGGPGLADSWRDDFYAATAGAFSAS